MDKLFPGKLWTITFAPLQWFSLADSLVLTIDRPPNIAVKPSRNIFAYLTFGSFLPDSLFHDVRMRSTKNFSVIFSEIGNDIPIRHIQSI